MKRSPGPTPCSPLSISSAASAPSSSCCTRAAMRAVSASRGRCTPGRSTSTIWQSPLVAHAADRAPRGLRAVGDDRDLLADDRVDERRLADVRPAGERDEAAARHALARRSSSRLQREHLAVVGLVVHAEQVQHAVHDRLAQVGGVRRADHDVAELARRPPARSAPSTPSIGNESTSVGLGFAAVVAR